MTIFAFSQKRAKQLLEMLCNTLLNRSWFFKAFVLAAILGTTFLMCGLGRAEPADNKSDQPHPFVPRTMAEQVADLCNVKESLAERSKQAFADARDDNVCVLVVLADPSADVTIQFYEALYTSNDARFRRAAECHRLLWVKATNANDVAKAGKEMSLDLSKLTARGIAVLNDKGTVLGSQSLSLGKGGKLAIAPLRDLLVKHILVQPDAEVLLADALAQAKQQNKRVFLQESGPWCAPCHRLSRFIEAHRDVFDENYVCMKIDRGRNAHGDGVIQHLRGQLGGIPWVIILDDDGKKMGTSDRPDGGNYGFPSAAAEVNLFVELLKSTAPRLSDKDAQVLQHDLSREISGD